MAKETDHIWQQRIREQLDGLQYGQVIVTVHDGQIVQIDRTERTRYPLTSAKESDDRISPTNKHTSHRKLASS